MIERLQNSRFPPPPARFGDGVLSPGQLGDDGASQRPYGVVSASGSEVRVLPPASQTLPRPERMASCGTQTAPHSPRRPLKVRGGGSEGSGVIRPVLKLQMAETRN